MNAIAAAVVAASGSATSAAVASATSCVCLQFNRVVLFLLFRLLRTCEHVS